MSVEVNRGHNDFMCEALHILRGWGSSFAGRIRSQHGRGSNSAAGHKGRRPAKGDELQMRFSPAWERLALASAMAVFLVGLAALDGNAKERFVIVHGQAEEVQEGARRANDNL